MGSVRSKESTKTKEPNAMPPQESDERPAADGREVQLTSKKHRAAQAFGAVAIVCSLFAFESDPGLALFLAVGGLLLVVFALVRG